MLRLRLPDRCKCCRAVAAVRLEQTIKARSVTLMWCCNACDEGWPIVDEDYQPERRSRIKDRRHQTRSDRRRRR
jgi:hypothetical protein